MALSVAEAALPLTAATPLVASETRASVQPTAAGLVSLNAPNASPASSHTPDADGWVTCGTLRVKGGTYGTDFIYYPDVFQYPKEDGTAINYGFFGYTGNHLADLILVLTGTPLTVKNADGTNTEVWGDTNAAKTCLWIAPGNRADVTLAGVNINGTPHGSIPINIMTNISDTTTGAWALKGAEIRHRTGLHLTLADGTKNYLFSNEHHMPAIRCGEGSDLIIDDAERNVDTKGNEVVPVGAIINQDVQLKGGKVLKQGDPHTALDSSNPGTLSARAGLQAAAIGGANEETGGTMTFNGGIITAQAEHAISDVDWQTGAAIGGGTLGNGTDGVLTFNSGTYHAIGNYHANGIGSGCGAKHGAAWDYAMPPDHIPCESRQKGGVSSDKWFVYFGATRVGNITINGGFVESTGYEHSSGFGNSCANTANAGGVIKITGGTLRPIVYGPYADFNAEGGHVVITGGSVYTNGSFAGIGGTAWGNDAWSAPGYDPDDPNDPNKVFMVTIDLAADMAAAGEAGDNLIESWSLKVGGEDYPYGAPTRLIDGKLYLWLPASATEQTVSVDLSYRGKDGQAHPFDTLFRNPGQEDLLKRYEDFELPQEYLDSLVKPYDGLPFKTYEITPEHPLRTPEVLSYDEHGNPSEYRWLTNTDDVVYRYRPYDKRGGVPIGDEVDGANGGKDMPTDVGVMKFTMVSREYSGSSDPALADFANGYWGHRATGWCEITPIPSKVSLLSAEWVEETDADKKPGSVEHSAKNKLKVVAEVRGGTFPDGTPTADTCKAPQGSFQLYVDGQPVGPVTPIRYTAGTDADGKPVAANATVVANPADTRGSLAHIEFEVTPADADLLFPAPGKDNTHVVSMRYLPPDAAQQATGATANYLASASPADDPEAAPKVEVAIKPVDPVVEVTGAPDPDCTDPDFPAPSVQTGAGEPTDAADPDGGKTYRGKITTTWGEPSEANPHPGRVVLTVKTESTAPISVTDAKGNVFTAEFAKGEDGKPLRGADGSYTLVLATTAVGAGQLTIKQEPNGAYTGTTWVYDVTVNPDVTVAPAPALTKKAQNLTHPNGPTQPGDRIRYTITASNTATGSLWMQGVVTDPLPACLDLDEKSLRLDNPRGGVADRALEKAPTVGGTDVGKFSLSAPAADGRPVLTVPVGNVAGGASATLAFECTVRADAASEGAPAADLSNVAQATGTRPDPADPEKPMPDPDNPGQPLPVNPDPTDPVTPPGPGRVVPADPVIDLAKTVENVTAPDAGTTHIGDKLRYTVTLANTGAANSCLVGAVVSDPLPAGIEPVAGTLRLSVDGGAPVAVPDAAYDRASRTIAVTCGDLWGGSRAVLTFDAIVEAPAVGADNGNIARVHGSVPSKDPDDAPTDPEPGKPATPPSGEPEASTPPTLPSTIIPDDPDRDDVTIEKTAENTSRDDGATHVGDTVRYKVELANGAVGTGWIDAVIRDDVPEGIEPVAGTLRLTLPDGREIAVDDGAYDPKTRILAVACGHLYGGQRVTLAFDALVVEAAVGADIGNVAVGYGTPPSEWDPSDPSPEPGTPFDPPGGWDAWERGRDRVVSDPAYPPGVDRLGGVVAEDLPREKERTTIAHKLAQTGDALAAAAGLPLALALAAAALALATRRRERAQ